jgi:hypothetical protein
MTVVAREAEFINADWWPLTDRATLRPNLLINPYRDDRDPAVLAANSRPRNRNDGFREPYRRSRTGVGPPAAGLTVMPVLTPKLPVATVCYREGHWSNVRWPKRYSGKFI